MFKSIKSALVAAALFLCLGTIANCGGGGGGGGNAATPQPTPPMTMTMTAPQPTYQVVYASVLVAENVAEERATALVPEDYRILTRNGVRVGTFASVTIITPGGNARVGNSAANQVIGNVLFPLDSSWQGTPNAVVGAIVAETVYVSDFAQHRCDSLTFQSRAGTQTLERAFRIVCVAGAARVTNTVVKSQQQIYQVCWRDNRRIVTCDFRYNDRPNDFIVLAFPEQNYRRDNGDCQSAPFYAVGNCQNENAVNVGNFAAFVSGLNGNGYRQFGIRHKWQSEDNDWNIAAMVSHAKGAEFLDTWWARTRFEHLLFDDVRGFAEYESGITSLRQNDHLFTDIPISGGRIGFGFGDITASFGRPMHYNGKGKNAAALHYQASKETGISFRQQNGNADIQWQWRRRF